MPRPTAARILYLLIGLILGLAATIGFQLYLLPSLSASIPFLSPPPAPQIAGGPTQFTASALERVLHINLAQEKNGVVVRVNTVEVYHDGFSLTYAVASGRTGAVPQTIEPEAFIVADDRGTPYTLSPLGTSAATSAGLTVGMVSFTPVPPAEIRVVRLTIPNLLVLGLRLREGQARVIAGPWEFQIPLRT